MSHILGTRREMEEISSRFSQESASEEIVISERECEYSFTHDVRQQPIDGDVDDFDDDEYIPSTYKTKNPIQLTIPSERRQTT